MNFDFDVFQLFRWRNGQPDNVNGSNLNLLAQGCTGASYDGLDDSSCSNIFPFVCEYTNQSLVSCPGNLYLDNILGCGWFLVVVE